MSKYRGRNQIIQSHSALARSIRGMLRYLYSVDKPTDEQKTDIKSLEEQALEHERKAMFFDSFVMIL